MTHIAPLSEPYPPALAAALGQLTPPGRATPMLFRIVARSPRAWAKLVGGSLLDEGPLSVRAREIVIFRTAARIGADYEWGMHQALFADACGLDADQLVALAHLPADGHPWPADEAALIATVDALIDQRHLDAGQHARMAAHFSPEQQLEIVQLVGFYQGIALIIGAFAIPVEPGTPAIPADPRPRATFSI